MARNKLNTKNLYEAAVKANEVERFYDDFSESLEKGEITPSDFSVRDLFEDFVEGGAQFISQWHREPENRVSITEAGVSTTTFSNITGQLLVNTVMEAYNGPAFIADQLCKTIPTKLPKGEKMPGLTEIGDEAEAIGEGQPYPLVGFGEDWIETPETIKRGMIIPLTREVIVADLTNQLFDRATGVGEWIGYNKEIRMLQTALGITSSYNRRSRGVVSTYDDNTGNHDFDNLAASNTLVDWTDFENALLLFDAMVDPNVGTPINVIGGDRLQCVVPTALLFTANRIVNATEIRFGDGASSTTQTISTNPVKNMVDVVSSQLVKTVTSSASTWFLGVFKKAFAYMQVSPVQVVAAPSNNHDEFHRDITNQWKVSEWGVAAVINPRYVIKNT